MSPETVLTGEEKLEDRLEKVIARLIVLEKQVKKLVDTLHVVDTRLKNVGFLKDINYQG